MFTVFRIMLGTTPLALYELAQRVYEGINLSSILPIDNTFLWWNLGQPDPYLILPILVFATMFIQQKFMSPAAKKNMSSPSGVDQTDAARRRYRASTLASLVTATR